MKKLKLDIDQLRVDSFGADAGEEGRGTVRGHDFTELATCNFRHWTCGITCNGGSACGGDTSNCPNTYVQTCFPVCTTGDAC
jgi:hypothetical protein